MYREFLNRSQKFIKGQRKKQSHKDRMVAQLEELRSVSEGSDVGSQSDRDLRMSASHGDSNKNQAPEQPSLSGPTDLGDKDAERVFKGGSQCIH